MSHKNVVVRMYRPEMEFRNRFCDQNLDPECPTKVNPGLGITELLVLYINDKDDQAVYDLPNQWTTNKKANATETKETGCEKCDYDEYINQKIEHKKFKKYMQSVDFNENGTIQTGFTKSELCYFQVNNSDLNLTPIRKIPAKD